MLTIIAAVAKNRAIGKDNKLIWHLPEDLKFFKENTIDKTIVMGSNTFYSLPGVLPRRKHIVLTQDDFKFPNDVDVYYDYNKLLNHLKQSDEEIFIIGGAAIYNLFIDDVDKLLITEIDKEYEADKFFPEIDYNMWEREVLSTHEYNGLNYEHVKYLRKVR